MMKKEDLFEAMENIDEKYITEVPEAAVKKRLPGRLWGITARNRLRMLYPFFGICPAIFLI